jgi:hypothetical protein
MLPIRQDYDKNNRSAFTEDEQYTMMTLFNAGEKNAHVAFPAVELELSTGIRVTELWTGKTEYWQDKKFQGILKP